MNKTAWMLAGAIAVAASIPAHAADDASQAPTANAQAWARWQGRVSFGAPSPDRRSELIGHDSATSQPSSLSLLGDYYFFGSLTGTGSTGGFRATGGVLLGSRSLAWSALSVPGTGNAFSIGSHALGRLSVPYVNEQPSDSATQPYIGVGYTGLSTRSGWAFSADLGLVAQYPGSVARLGRGQTLDEVVRELRLAPLVQVGVAYSF